MNRPCEERTWLVAVHPLFHQQRVGAQVHEAPLLDQSLDDLIHLRMQQRLATRDGYHGSAAVPRGVQAFIDAQAAVQQRVGVIDLAAAGAGEIAAEQRLQHQDQRIALHTAQVAADHIGADHSGLQQRNSHFSSLGNGRDGGLRSDGRFEFGRQTEAHRLLNAGQRADTHPASPLQRGDDFLDKVFRSGRPRRDANR